MSVSTDSPETRSTAIVFGASGAIGGAFVDLLRAERRCHVIELSRSGAGSALDVMDENSVEAAAKNLEDKGPVELFVNCIGLLHNQTGVAPEKSLKQIDPTSLEAYFQINAVGPALLLKHFTPLMPRDRRSVFVSLSARVGSLEDNRLGGWYGYRASKAAHNMIVRNAAIELARTHPLAVLAAIHPGTVASPLSAPYAKGHATCEPHDAAACMLSVINDLQPEQSGGFYAYDGSAVPW